MIEYKGKPAPCERFVLWKKNAHIIYFTRLFSKKEKNNEVSFCNTTRLNKREASALRVPRSLERNTPHILFIYFAQGYFLKNKKIT